MQRPQTQASYQDRIDRVMDHVYTHLEEDLSFDRLAEIACLSSYHWSRIFHAMRGETIAAAIRRLRLQRAADRLANSDLDIAVIAERAGYASPDTLLGTWLPASGYAPDDAPILEAYLNDPREVPQRALRTDILLPLRG